MTLPCATSSTLRKKTAFWAHSSKHPLTLCCPTPTWCVSGDSARQKQRVQRGTEIQKHTGLLLSSSYYVTLQKGGEKGTFPYLSHWQRQRENRNRLLAGDAEQTANCARQREHWGHQLLCRAGQSHLLPSQPWWHLMSQTLMATQALPHSSIVTHIALENKLPQANKRTWIPAQQITP